MRLHRNNLLAFPELILLYKTFVKNPRSLSFLLDFKSDGSVHAGIELVDVYQIFTRLLNVPAQPNNGTWDNVRYMLVDPSGAESSRMVSPALLIVSILSIVVSARTSLL